MRSRGAVGNEMCGAGSVAAMPPPFANNVAAATADIRPANSRRVSGGMAWMPIIALFARNNGLSFH